MSDRSGSNRGSRRGGASDDGKPNHVKRLNFGLSILELDVLEQRERPATSSNRALLVIDQDVAGIPCTGKKDYVRKWIEAHEDEELRCDPVSEPSQSSLGLGTSATNSCKVSPVLGNSGKRLKKRTRANRCVATVESVDNADNADCQEQSSRHSVNCAVQRRLDYRNTEENDNEEHLNETQHIPPCIGQIVGDRSPVIGARSYSHKKRCRKLSYDSEEGISTKRLMLDKNKFIDTHIGTTTDNDSDKVRIFSIEEEESPERLETCTFLSRMQEELSSNDGSINNNKENPKIEVDTSCDSKDEDCNEFSSTNGNSNDSLSKIIEEVDTLDMIMVMEKPQVSAKPLLMSRPSIFSQPITNASDETYCSEAEMMLDQSMHLSTKISPVPSGALSKDVAGSKSTQTPVISTITTPSKTSLDKTVHAHLLDSGKKRHKPKKGTMIAKLQFLINAQVSSIRIWRHRMNKERDAASVQFISVLVRDCSERFGNQFLHGILIEDRFNLLQSNVEIEEAESCNVQALPKETTYRDITVILVCDIVGSLKMISQVVINVYPPWDILDKVDLTLEATYISINHSREMPDLTSKNNSRKREKRIIKEFNCPCMEEGRELPFCARKPNVDKPDVMQVIFGA